MFFAVLKPCLYETAFYAKVLWRFLDPKIKVSRLIALRFSTNLQINNLKLLSKFHAAGANRFRVISKNRKLRSYLFENDRVKPEEHATRRRWFQLNPDAQNVTWQARKKNARSDKQNWQD